MYKLLMVTALLLSTGAIRRDTLPGDKSSQTLDWLLPARLTPKAIEAKASGLLGQLIEMFAGEGWAMSYTMDDFVRDYIKKHFPQLTPEEQRETLAALPLEERCQVVQSLPLEERLAGLSAEESRAYLDQLTAERPTPSRKPRRKS